MVDRRGLSLLSFVAVELQLDRRGLLYASPPAVDHKGRPLPLKLA